MENQKPDSAALTVDDLWKWHHERAVTYRRSQRRYEARNREFPSMYDVRQATLNAKQADFHIAACATLDPYLNRSTNDGI